MPLIGSNTWDPQGESMWSIVSHLSQQNYLNWVEIRRLFGANELRSFSTEVSQNPDTPENFGLGRLIASTSWEPRRLRSSFSKGHQPPWLASDEQTSLRKSNRYLRVCPKCLENGSHLMLHQLLDWVRCPLHDEPLTARCPHCSNVLGRFLITNSLERIGGRCQHCNHPVLASNSPQEHQRSKTRMMSEFTTWLRAIQSHSGPGQ